MRRLTLLRPQLRCGWIGGPDSDELRGGGGVVVSDLASSVGYSPDSPPDAFPWAIASRGSTRNWAIRECGPSDVTLSQRFSNRSPVVMSCMKTVADSVLTPCPG